MPLLNYFLLLTLLISEIAHSEIYVNIIKEKPLLPPIIQPLPLDLDDIARFDVFSAKGCNDFVLSSPDSDMYTSLDIVKHINAPHYSPDKSVSQYYDVFIDGASEKEQNEGVLVAQLPSQQDFEIYLSVGFLDGERGLQFMGLVTYRDNKKIDELMVEYAFGIQPNNNQHYYANKMDGYAILNLFFEIDKNYIISTYAIDINYIGEEGACDFIRKEQWVVHPSGQFVRYYAKNGAFKNHEEQGDVVNHYRHGLWIEIKPNKNVRKMTYLESYFYHGLPVGQWKYYDYTGGKKGELLYTEKYGS